LTLAYSAAVGLALAAAGVALDFFHGQMLGARLDDTIKNDIEEVEHRTEFRPDGTAVVPADVGDAPELQRRRVRIASPEGRAFLDDPLLAGAPAPGREPKFSYFTIEGFRVGSTLCRRNDRDYVVQVARLEPAGEIARMRRLLLLAWAGTLAVSALGAWLLVGRTLKPVDQMTRAAREISADFCARVPVVNPNDELGRLGGTLNDMLGRLCSSIDRLRQFTSDASHELRTPLTAARTVGEVALREDRPPEEYRDAIGSMLEEIERLTRIVDKLLYLARADGGAIPVERTETRLDEIAREVSDQFRVVAADRNIRLEGAGGPSRPFPCDAEKVRLALVNLVDNAIKFTPPGGTVTLGAEVNGREARLWVLDTGPGIAPDHLERIFERFYRVDRTRGAEGAGLGLAIARWAIECQEGRILAESRPGAGSKFTIVLRDVFLSVRNPSR
jgi:heavy metal sensor kinase